MNHPDFVLLHTDKGILDFSAGKDCIGDCHVRVREKGGNLKIETTAEQAGISYLQLRWNFPVPPGTRFCGDALERTYGDLQWSCFDGDRGMPWYFMMHNESGYRAFGVRVRCGSLAYWFADPQGVSLFLDLRCGAAPCFPKGRIIEAAEVVEKSYGEISFAAAQTAFCREMCSDPLLAEKPVYGSNNWYYAYGNITQESVLEDCRIISTLCKGFDNRPFMVIDSGWADRSFFTIDCAPANHRNPAPGGDWARGNDRFPDMAALAEKMRSSGVHPGLWIAPVEDTAREVPDSMYLKRPWPKFILDVSIPEALERVRTCCRRIHDWGFELIKHDFTTYDLLGRWGFEARPLLACGHWSFADTTRTSAEIITDLYRAIKEGAGSTYVSGCNTIGHLCAGLHEISRSGDDTSGRDWARTLKMGVNTLAYRIGQHRTFFDLDPDCVCITEQVPWEKNMEFAKLAARTGAVFFASITPGYLTETRKKELRSLFKIASERSELLFPEDIMDTVTPQHWVNAEGKRFSFDWYEASGVVPEQICAPLY